MSEGPFLDAFYTLDDRNSVSPIRIQPETAALVVNGETNTIPAGPADYPAYAKVSAGRKSRGLNARLVYIRIQSAGTSGLQVGGRIALPWLDPVSWSAFRKGDPVVYRQGATGILTGKSAETGI